MDRDSVEWKAFGYAHGLRLYVDDLEWFVGFARDRKRLNELPTPLADLVRADLETLDQGLLSFEGDGRAQQIETRLSNCYQQAQDVYQSLGFKIPDFDLHLVDRLPDPYDDENLWGLTLDAQDARETGAAAGIYMKKSTAYPLLAEATLCHEMVHSLFSFVEADHLVRGYEEGACDLISFMALCRAIGNTYAKSVLVRYRLYTRDPFDFAYRDALRQACSTVLAIGGDRWLDLMRQIQSEGRASFLRLEESLIAEGSMPVVKEGAPASKTEAGLELESLSLQLLATPESYVLSPDAFAVAQVAAVGDTTERLLSKLQTHREMDRVLKALEELSGTLRLVVTDDNIITANEAPLYIRTKTLRYSHGS